MPPDAERPSPATIPEDLERKRARFRRWGQGLGVLPGAALLALPFLLAGQAGAGAIGLLVALAPLVLVIGSAAARHRLYPHLMPKAATGLMERILLVASAALGVAASTRDSAMFALPYLPAPLASGLALAAALAVPLLGVRVGATRPVALVAVFIQGLELSALWRPDKSENVATVFLGMAMGIAFLGIEEHLRARRLERALASLGAAAAPPPAPGPRVALGGPQELEAATRTYARYVSGRANGLRYLPAAACLGTGALLFLVSPAWGLVGVAPVPLLFVAELQLWPGLYAGLGGVIEDPDHPEPSTAAFWLYAVAFHAGSAYLLWSQREALLGLPPAPRSAYLALILASLVGAPLLAWLRRVRGELVVSAAGLMFVVSVVGLAMQHPQRVGAILATQAALLASLGLSEHVRFKRLAVRFARSRDLA